MPALCKSSARSLLAMASCTVLGFGAATMLGLGNAPVPADPPKADSVALDAVPADVKKAIEFHAPGATLMHAWKETENGTVFYQIKVKAKDGDKVEFRAVESGRLVEVMHDMAPDRLPPDVTDQVKKLIPGGEIVSGERHMAIRWRVEVKTGAVVKDVILRADGKHAIVEPEAKPEAKAQTKPAGK